MEAYKIKQRVVDRTLTVELPAEFENAEVEVIVLQNEVFDSLKTKKADKWQSLRDAKGIARNSTVEIDEEEWYKQ
ncbi:MAG: hypothetical protein WBA23_05955 [Tunicatimonas sp.]|uniref:hypothetical protein n=1 Tax=Tunicatimonas sp. TaxID=1940096 RepID=UPI003C71DBB4